MTTRALTPLLIGAGLSLTLYALKAEISHPVQRNITRDRPLDKWASLGDWAGKVYPNLIYTGYGVLAGLLGSERGYLRAEEMFLATAYSGIATSILKVTFQEGRPNNPVDRKSMPSGPTTAAFSFAGVIGAEHEWYVAVPAYALATLVGYSRINDNKHYLHDVTAGATVGLSYALGVYYRRQEGDSLVARKSPWPTIQVVPLDGFEGAMLGMAKRF